MNEQINLQQRIVVEEDFKVNNSPLKLKVAFLNQEITTDSKNEYYKLLIWLIGQESVSDFAFNLFLKSTNNQVLIPLENFQENFQPNDQNYLIAEIPSKIFDLNFNELTYTFAHDQLFVGQGKIFLNLKNDSQNQINNELIFYENHQSFNLIERKINWDFPEFYFNRHYQKLIGMQYQTFDYSSQFNLEPIIQMANLVRNNIWTIPLQFLDLTIENVESKKYVFEPNCEVLQANNFFKINFLNQLVLNQNGQIVEGGNTKGLFFNPLIASQQLVKFKIKTFNLVKEIVFWIHLPKLNLSSRFQGEWLEV